MAAKKVNQQAALADTIRALNYCYGEEKAKKILEQFVEAAKKPKAKRRRGTITAELNAITRSRSRITSVPRMDLRSMAIGAGIGLAVREILRHVNANPVNTTPTETASAPFTLGELLGDLPGGLRITGEEDDREDA